MVTDFDEDDKTYQRPQDQPDFNPAWMKAYGISPTVNLGDASKNPMPRLKNPDPNGYIMGQVKAGQKMRLKVICPWLNY